MMATPSGLPPASIQALKMGIKGVDRSARSAGAGVSKPDRSVRATFLSRLSCNSLLSVYNSPVSDALVLGRRREEDRGARVWGWH